MERIRMWLWAFGIYLSAASFVTFSLFICEEAFQTTMFGTWPASDVGDWSTVKTGVTVMRGINRTLKVINYSCGWIQPFAFISYRAYGKSADFYIRGLTSKVMSNAPELFIGEEVKFEFPVKSIIKDKNGNTMTSFKRILVPIDVTTSPGDVIAISGMLRKTDGKLVLTLP